MTTLPTLTTIPAHAFEPAKRATGNGLVDDPRCGYHHRIDADTGVWCGEFAAHSVHSGSDFEVVVCDHLPEEIEAMNR